MAVENYCYLIFYTLKFFTCGITTLDMPVCVNLTLVKKVPLYMCIMRLLPPTICCLRLICTVYYRSHTETCVDTVVTFTNKFQFFELSKPS
jgi:hypothetical protein